MFICEIKNEDGSIQETLQYVKAEDLYNALVSRGFQMSINDVYGIMYPARKSKRINGLREKLNIKRLMHRTQYKVVKEGVKVVVV